MKIISREEWSAKNRAGFGSRAVGSLDKWLHHSASSNLPDNASRATEGAVMRSLERVGQHNFGGGISYTFLIFPSGRVYEGVGIDRVGAHTAGRNTGSAGICVVGNYEKAEPSEQALESLAELLAHGVTQGWWKDATLTGGHRDTKATACPGSRLYARIADINKRATALAAAGVSPAATTTPSKPSKKPTGSGGGSSYTGGSIVDYLASLGQPSNFAARAALARKHGVRPYTGTAAQNTRLLALLRAGGTSTPAKPSTPAKSVATMAAEVIAGKHGNGHATRRKSLGVNAATYAKVRAEVNRRLG